jgi:hypothetical protein
MSVDSKAVSGFQFDGLRDALYHLANGDPMLSLIYLPFSDWQILLTFLARYRASAGKELKKLHIRTVVDMFMRRFGGPGEDLDRALARRDLEESSDRTVKFLVPHLFNQGNPKLDDQCCRNICCFLLLFYDSWPGAFRVLYQEISQLIQRVTPRTFFSILGSDCLYLFDANPAIDFFQTGDLDFTELPTLFKAPVLFSSPELAIVLQTRAVGVWGFPHPTPGVIEGLLFSLANSVLISSVHFLDLISQNVLELLTTGEFEGIPANLACFPEFAPYVLCAHQPLLYAKLPASQAIIGDRYPDSLAAACTFRFRNDAKLIEILSFLTETRIPSDSLYKQSIPKFLEFVLGQTEILSYATLDYFSISDSDRNADFDFIRAYNACRIFLTVLTFLGRR